MFPVELLSDGAEYLSSGAKTIRGGTVNDGLNYLFNNRSALNRSMSKDVATAAKYLPGVSAKNAVRVGRMAGKAIPLLSAISNVTDVADLIAGDDGLDNKLVDAAGMGIGGTAGFFLGGPLGASIGASLGKTVTDGVQGMFFSEPTKEEKLAEALALLQGGRI